MTSTSRKRGRADEQMQTTEAVGAAESAVGKSNERSKKATSGIFLALRILSFVLACVFAVLGVTGLIQASSNQSTALVVATDSVKANPVRHAIVLFSGPEDDAAVGYERDGLLGVFDPSGISADLFHVNDIAGAHASEAEADLAASIYDRALEEGGYDAVVAVGDEALQFVMGHRELFGAIPTAFFAVTGDNAAQQARSAGYATGFVEQGGPALSLQNATALVPKANRLVVLVDGSASANGLLAQVQASSGAASGLQRSVWDVSTLSRDQLAKDLSQLDANTIVLLLSAGVDSAGNVYSPTETAYFVNEHSGAPVFSSTGGVGEGVCGSAFFDREAEGADAAKLAVELMNGGAASATPVVQVGPVCGTFDVAALQSRGLNPDATPGDSALINEPTFSMRVLRPMIRPALFLLAAVACIALFAVIGFRRSVRSNQAIIESRNDLQYRLFHDLLTDLPNRHALDQFAADPKTGDRIQSMVQVDIKDFTDINDSYGHAFGDSVIRVLTERLSKVKSSMLARSGGDEFTLVFDHALSPDSSELRAISQAFRDPVDIGGDRVDVGCTIGIANRGAGMSSGDLTVFSDLALGYGKDNNLRVPVFYTADMRADMEKKLRITSCLKEAVSAEDITVAWQPQVDTKTLKVVGYEALCRLRDNQYYPSEFIPVAEMSGLVIPLDRLMTKRVVEQMGTWLKQGREVGVASVNFSAAQLRDQGYCDFLAGLLRDNGVPASLMKIEITESMIIGNEEEAEKLFAQLRAMGITLALDDFGTGYSSLYQMASRPVDVVKLDKSLVDTFLVPGKEEFIENVTRLIHGLGKSIVVEGVETFEQYQMCLDLGCDVIQGFFFGRPMSAADVMQLDPAAAVAEARTQLGDKTRNGDWRTYDRDENGRWKKKS